MSPAETQALTAVARNFGDLWLHELDAARRDALLAPDVAAGLGEVGIEVAPLGAEGALDELAAEFLEVVLRPTEGAPLVQSLWTSGRYEGDAAVVVRKLAEAAGASFDREAARGAPHDHLGSILILWSVTAEDTPPVAARLASDHLRWALAPLRRIADGEGFYAQLARATAALIEELSAG